MFFPENPCNQTVRWASKKASGSTRNKRKSTPGKARGWKKNEGDHVEKGMILFRQLGLKVYPGENVRFKYLDLNG